MCDETPSVNIDRFLDGSGKIKVMPARQSVRLAVLLYLGGKFTAGARYAEREVNGIIDEWHTFNDYFLLRRELVDAGILLRTKNGSAYWRATDTGDVIHGSYTPPSACVP